MTRTSRRRPDKSWLNDVPKDKVFRCDDTHAVKNLDDLVVALREMPEEVFHRHGSNPIISV